jgi:fatty acid desaturase
MSSSQTSFTDTEQSPESFDLPNSEKTKPIQLLSAQELGELNERSNLKGSLQLAGHLAVMGISGYLWASQMTDRPWLAFLALPVYGFTLASMFATMHECVHRTAFANNQVNDMVAWLAGLLSFYNGTFYRRYHKWHHRYTQLPGKDPELEAPKPTTFKAYLLEVSALPWWVGKLKTHFRIARGQVEGYPYIPETARDEVVRSVRLQLLVYGVAIGLSIAFQQPWFLVYWLLPLIVAQPILRAILLAEHGGCSYDDNPLTNTRTTLTLFPIRFLMWNMPFHAEHHFCASFPFHALPAAHAKLASHFTHVDPGYLSVNRKLVANLGHATP